MRTALLALLVVCGLSVGPSWSQGTFAEATTTTNVPGVTGGTPPVTIETVPATQNTVTTSGPVTSTTTISAGTIAGQVLTWLAAAFSIPIGSFLTMFLMRLAKSAGVQVTDAMKAQLQGIVINALNSAAANSTDRLKGQSPIAIKSQIVGEAVSYVQVHGSDVIKSLGLDPHSGAAVEAIRARIETAIADPAQPTPAVLNPPGVAPKVAV